MRSFLSTLLLSGVLAFDLSAASLLIGPFGVPSMPQVSAPTYSPDGGLAGTNVTLSAGGLDVLFYSTTNGWVTTNMGSVVSNVPTGTISAYAAREGYLNSPVSTSQSFTNPPAAGCATEQLGQASVPGQENNFYVGLDTQYHSAGEVFTNASSFTACAVALTVSTAGADPETITGKNFAVQVETYTGTVLATTADFAGVQAWSTTRITNSLTSPVTLSAGTAYRIRMVPKSTLGQPFLYVIANNPGSVSDAYAAGWESNGTTTYSVQPAQDACFGLLR